MRIFHDAPEALGFAAVGEVAVTEDDVEQRAPFRLTLVATHSTGGWRLRQFHGSLPSDL